MAKQLQKLELTWIGKGNEPQLEPRILIEDPEKSYWAGKENGAAPPWHNRLNYDRNDSLNYDGNDILNYDGNDLMNTMMENKNHSPSDNQKNHSSDNCNMLIHGDNLLALKALEQNYAGKIKCIYIDPPYNTGNAFEHYDDGVEHSQWLSLMKPRLEILRTLLQDDGSIWINLDDSEVHYLKVVCDEIFGRDNFRSFITWQRKYSVSNNFKGIASICDYILVYSKSSSFQNNLLARSDESKSRYNNPDNDPRGPWKSVDYLNQATPLQRKNLCYDITNPNTGVVIKNTKKAWKYDPNTHKLHVAENRIWWGLDGKNTTPALKLFLSEVRDGMTPHNWWSHQEVGHTDEAKKESINLFGTDFSFSTPKPERLIQRVLELTTNENDIVLDSFLGSGTTAAVAHKMKRKWIGIELGEHAHTHCLPRLQKVVSGLDKGGITEAVNWQGGGGFKFYTLAPSLIQKDKYGSEIINPSYNANMLAAAMAKQEGFRYSPNESSYWKQGFSSEKDFIFTTTQFITVQLLDRLAEELKPGESLLVCCKSFSKGCANRHSNITIKKIPQMLLGRCEFGKDDYSFNIVNLPNSLNYDENDEMSTMIDEGGAENESLSNNQKNHSSDKKKKKKGDDEQPILF